MKKLILSALVVGSLLATSCKDAKEAGSNLTDAVANTAEKAGDVANVATGAVANGANTVAGAAGDVANVAAGAVANGANAVAGAAGDVANGAAGLADKATGALTSAVAGVTIPKFADAKVGAHLQEYSTYAKDYIAAGADAYKKPALVAKGADLVAKGKTILAGLDSESATKFKTVLSTIQSKMAPAK